MLFYNAEPRRGDTLSHTYFQNVMHIVFSTKERQKIIPTQMKERLWAYTAGICQHQSIFVHAIKDIKANSSRWMSDEIGRFAWQEGYGGFGVSKSNIAAVARYIQNQER